MNHYILWNSDLHTTHPAPSKSVHYSHLSTHTHLFLKEGFEEIVFERQNVFIKHYVTYDCKEIIFKLPPIYFPSFFTWRTELRLSEGAAPFEAISVSISKDMLATQRFVNKMVI